MNAPALLAIVLLLLDVASLPAWGQVPQKATQYHAPLLTGDGVRATLYRYAPAGPPAVRAVLLLPDVGMTHHAFELGSRGLAPYLQNDGWEVNVLEYRGAGRSEVPFGGYRLEDLLDRDAEAAFARALEGREKIAVGGVGLGATFALALAARHAERVFGALALQPLVAPDVPNEPIARAIEQIEGAPTWIDLSALMSAPLFNGRSRFEIVLGNDGSFDGDELASLRRHVLAPVPRIAVLQAARAMKERRLEVGGRSVADLLRGWAKPTLAIFAPRDNWIHPEFAVPVRDLLPRASCHVRVLDVVAGAKRNYGHLGMLLGSNAREDVFAPAARFLAETAP